MIPIDNSKEIIKGWTPDKKVEGFVAQSLVIVFALGCIVYQG